MLDGTDPLIGEGLERLLLQVGYLAAEADQFAANFPDQDIPSILDAKALEFDDYQLQILEPSEVGPLGRTCATILRALAGHTRRQHRGGRHAKARKAS